MASCLPACAEFWLLQLILYYGGQFPPLHLVQQEQGWKSPFPQVVAIIPEDFRQYVLNQYSGVEPLLKAAIQALEHV